MADNETKSHDVTMIVTLSEETQIIAAKQQATAISGVGPGKLVAIGKPSLTKEGLRVEFGVTE